MLAAIIATLGRPAIDRSLDPGRLDGLTLGLRGHYRRVAVRTPAALRRLRRVRHSYAAMSANGVRFRTSTPRPARASSPGWARSSARTS